MRRDWEPEELEFAPRGPVASCPPPSLVLGATDGDLPADLAASVQQHVAECAICRQLASDLASRPVPTSAAKERVRKRLAPHLSQPRRRMRWLIGLTAPAAVAVAAAILVWGPTRSAKHAAYEVVHAPLPVPRPQPVISSAVPKAPVVLPASVLVFRGQAQPGGSEMMLRAFGEAIRPYREDRYAEAIARLEEFTRQYPQMAEGYFYLGVSRLLAGQTVQGRADLEHARELSRPPFRELVDRYLQPER